MSATASDRKLPYLAPVSELVRGDIQAQPASVLAAGAGPDGGAAAGPAPDPAPCPGPGRGPGPACCPGPRCVPGSGAATATSMISPGLPRPPETRLRCRAGSVIASSLKDTRAISISNCAIASRSPSVAPRITYCAGLPGLGHRCCSAIGRHTVPPHSGQPAACRLAILDHRAPGPTACTAPHPAHRYGLVAAARRSAV